MLNYILYFILGSALVWIPVLIFCPILEITEDLPETVTARNTVYKIKIRKELDNWLGILAQEFYESKFKQNPVNLIKLLLKDEDLEREMEIVGHEITVQFLPENKQHMGRIQHANALKKHYSVFKDWSVDVIYELLRNESSYAQDWISDNIRKITDLERKRYE